ncbi:hypothetical protein MMC26_005250 [Xylographa opegraphella]|nr:hypothetical protein [Xylographa opegraphella]
MAAPDNKMTAPLADITGAFANTLGTTSWSTIKPTEYDYNVYNATTREEREAAETRLAQRLSDTKIEDDTQFTADVPLWASNAVKYEWNDEFGDVGPRHPELEKQLFRDQYTNRAGNMMATYAEINVTMESEQTIKPILKFEDAGLHPIMLENVKLCGYANPTPIQGYCLPAILSNNDLIAVAQTGSGKTAAFLIPVLSKLMGKVRKLAAPRPNVAKAYNPATDGVRAEPLVLIVCPTRELATQIFDEARRLCYRSMLRPCVVYGGGPTREQADELRKGCDVLIATPGRLMDFMKRGNLLGLNRVRYTIIDEADEMVGTDWSDDMNMILSGADNNEDADHRFMMFSATFPKEARKLAKVLLASNYIRIRVGRAGGTTHLNVTQNVVFVEESRKREAVFEVLMSTPPARTIIFVNGKKSADFLDDYLYNRGLPSTSIHSDRTQREREDAMRAFRSAKAPVLVATGVSARGLDILNVMHVINYDLPSKDHGGIQEYIHRIGRTARIGNVGIATSFYNDRNEDLAEDLAKILTEAKQNVPEFLEQYKPENPDSIEWGDESDGEDEDAADGGDGWGAPAEVADDGWGSAAAPVPAAATPGAAEASATAEVEEDLAW